MEKEPVRDKLFQFRWVLILGLIHGFLYVFLMPPWQHYDEPNHFEVAWLVSQGVKYPTNADSQPEFVRELMQSMVDHDFYKELDYFPNLTVENLKLGFYSQFGDPRLYYWLSGAILSFFPNQDVTTQLYIGRLFSLTLYLFTIFAAWKVTRVITPPGHPIRIAVPYFLVFVPGFVDLMTAFNNEVLAVALASMVLWGFVHILHNGVRFWNTVLTGFGIFLAFLTRGTLYHLFPIFVIVVLIGIYSKTRVTRRIWIGVLIISIVSVGVVFTFGDAAHWLRGIDQRKLTRVETPASPVGDYAFQFDPYAETTPKWIEPLSQGFPIQISDDIKGETIYVGAWIWADNPQELKTPIIRQGYREWYRGVMVGKNPKFFSFKLKVKDEPERVWIAIDPFSDQPIGGTIYYDGIVVTDQEIGDITQEPIFDDKSGESGSWDGTPFQNIARNPSAERGWMTVSPIFDDLGSRVLPDDARPSFILGVVEDFGNFRWFITGTVHRLIRTFWAKFGWAHINLIGHKPYRIFGVLTLLGLVGAAAALIQDVKKFPKNSVLIFSLILIGLWVPNLCRGFVLLASNVMYYPVSRYNYPSMIAVAYFLTTGWIFLLDSISIPKNVQAWLYFTIFVAVDIWSVVSILLYYRGGN